MEHNTSPPLPRVSWLKEHGQKLVALFFWIALILGYRWYTQTNNLTALQAVQNLLAFFAGNIWGPLVYIIVYAIRPLILFPATLISVAAGFVFGPLMGVFWVIVASNLSATIAYLVGRFFGHGLLEESSSDSWITHYTHRMRGNSFETVLMMRFIFLPYDLVSYLTGFLRIRYLPFILATALGSIPGTIAFVWFGASIDSFDGGLPQINSLTLSASIGIFFISLALARIFRKLEGKKQ